MIGDQPRPVRTSPLDPVTRSNCRIADRTAKGRWTGIGDKGAQFANRQGGV